MSRFIEIFADELITNNPLNWEKATLLVQDIIQSLGLVTLPAAFILGASATYILVKYEESLVAKLLVELLGLLMALSPILMPFKAVRFFMGLYLFASYLSVHSRCFTGSDSKAAPSMFQQVNRTFFANLPPRLTTASSRLPSLQRIAYSLSEMVLIDLALYLMQEAIPVHIKPDNQYFAIALIGGVWVLLAMDLFYSNLIIALQLIGFPIPLQLRHRHPLLSTSLAEFWGARWNPIICRLLQDSFYKPLRSLGLPRLACVIGCFAGSALLHAWPQFASTMSWTDTSMMFCFFFGQGLLLTIELIVTHLLPAEQPSEPVKGGGSHTRANYQWLLESIIVGGLLSLCYIWSESALSPLFHNLSTAAIAVSIISSVLFHQFEVLGMALFQSPLRAMLLVLGWVWAVGSVIAMLPLFSIPVFHALGALYDRSYIVGPLIRTAYRAHEEGITTAFLRDATAICLPDPNATIAAFGA